MIDDEYKTAAGVAQLSAARWVALIKAPADMLTSIRPATLCIAATKTELPASKPNESNVCPIKYQNAAKPRDSPNNSNSQRSLETAGP
jgi:hypothetical protein